MVWIESFGKNSVKLLVLKMDEQRKVFLFLQFSEEKLYWPVQLWSETSLSHVKIHHRCKKKGEKFTHFVYANGLHIILPSSTLCSGSALHTDLLFRRCTTHLFFWYIFVQVGCGVIVLESIGHHWSLWPGYFLFSLIFLLLVRVWDWNFSVPRKNYAK